MSLFVFLSYASMPEGSCDSGGFQHGEKGLAGTRSSLTSPPHTTAVSNCCEQLLLGAQEEEEGLVTKLKKNCSSQQAWLKGVHLHARKKTELGVQPSTFIRGSSQPHSWTQEPTRAPSTTPHCLQPDGLEESPHNNPCLPGVHHLCPLPMATELILPPLGMKGKRTCSLPAFPRVGSPPAFPH